MRMIRPVPFLLAAALSAGLAPLAVSAQGVTFTSNTTIKAGGALGVAFKIAGVSNMTQTTYVAGHKMRTDSKDNSVIYDVDAGQFTTVDHKKKTYSTVTFQQMAEQLKQTRQDIKAEKAKADKEAAEKGKAEESDVEWDVKVSAERTGARQKIAGYDSQQQLVTVTVTAHEKGKPVKPNQGALVAFMDIWTSSSAPQAAAMAEFSKAYAQRMNKDFGSPMKGLEAAFGADPRMKAALEASAKEMSKVQGVALKSTTSIIGVPEGMGFDKQLALGATAKSDGAAKDEPQPKKGGLFGKLKAVAEQAAQQNEGKDEGKAAPKQTTILAFGDEVQEIKSGVPSGVFSIPAGYKEVKSELGKMR